LKGAAETEAKQSAVREQERHNAAASRRHNGTWALEIYSWRKSLLEEKVAREDNRHSTDDLRHAEREKRILDLVPALEQLDTLGVERGERIRALELALEKNRPLLDELADAAISLVAAIELELEALQVRMEFGRRRLNAIAAALKVARERQSKETEELGGLKARYQAASDELADLERQRVALVSAGALGDGEPARKGLQRHLRAAEMEAQRTKEEADKAARFEQQAIEKERLRSEAVSAASTFAEQRRALEQAIVSAELELRKLSEDLVLQRTLEDSSPDLMRLLPQALSRLASTRVRLHEQLVVLGIEAQIDRRAVDSLTGGQALLPPPVDAERVQMALRSAGLSAFTGVAYLADTVAPERAERVCQAKPSGWRGQGEPAGEGAQREVARHLIPMIEICAERRFAPHDGRDRAEKGGHREQGEHACCEAGARERRKYHQDYHAQREAHHHLDGWH